MSRSSVERIHAILRGELTDTVTGLGYSLAHIEQAATPVEFEYFKRRMIAGQDRVRFLTHLVDRLGKEVPAALEAGQ